MNTRAQHDMRLAADRVAEVVGSGYEGTYGGLCHSFPVMVRTCGLCQAVAFSAAKASGDGDAGRKAAHRRILEDVKEITGVATDRIADLEVGDYMLYTRRLLAAWIYFKRFAESILKVPSSDNAGEGTDG